jgi:hypothetical protein
MVSDDSGAETVGWLSLAEAAEQLGISVDAVRRRLRRGDFPQRRVRTRHGLAWQVQLVPAEGGATLDASLVPIVEASIEPTVAELLSYLRERDRVRDAEVAQLRADLDGRAEQLGALRAQLAEREERIRVLEAPLQVDRQTPALAAADSSGFLGALRRALASLAAPGRAENRA